MSKVVEMGVAYILAKINGDHWRFIGLPIVSEEQAYQECDFSTGEHVVCIRFAPPAPKEADHE